MSVIKFTPDLIANGLICPTGKQRHELVDDQRTGLYVEVRATSPGEGTFYIRYKDASGKTCHQKIGRTTDITLAEARKRAKDQKAEIRLGADPRGELKAKKAVPTLAAFFEDYLKYIKPRKRSWAGDVGLFNNRIKPAFGHLRLNELKRQEVQTFHANLLTQGIAEATADHHVKLLRQMLNRAVEWGVIEVNPITRIKLFNPDNRLEHYLDPAELERLLNVLRTDSNRTVCNVAMLLISTGARLNEALSATWEHIDRPNRVWRIPAATSKSKRVRSVPLNDAALDAIAALDTEGQSKYLFVSTRKGEDGKATGRLRHIHKVWERLRTAAGLPNLRLHDLRHQYASFLVNSGRSLYEVQKILGHSSHSVTERYAHLSSKSLMDAANSASIILKGAMPPAGQGEEAA